MVVVVVTVLAEGPCGTGRWVMTFSVTMGVALTTIIILPLLFPPLA